MSTILKNSYQNLTKILGLIKFSHTVFALPFALIAMLLAANGAPTLHQIIWVVLAMTGARSGAMSFNRLADIKIDLKNERTALRPSASGELKRPFIILFCVLSYMLLILSAYQLNELSFYLSPVAVILTMFYSYTKRFTFLCHLYLGFAISVAPIGAWIAITGEISAISLILALSILFWIAGFDILYALQDRDFDIDEGLHSIPVKFGVKNSLIISRILHALAVVCWLAFYNIAGLGLPFLSGVIISTMLLIYEHSLVKADDLSALNMAFFNMNSTISVVLFTTLLLDIYY